MAVDAFFGRWFLLRGLFGCRRFDGRNAVLAGPSLNAAFLIGPLTKASNKKNVSQVLHKYVIVISKSNIQADD